MQDGDNFDEEENPTTSRAQQCVAPQAVRQPTMARECSKSSSVSMNVGSCETLSHNHEKKYIHCFDDPDFAQEEYE